ncbi:MAG: PhoH family protein, partial [Saprospiraceae bacterium]
MSELILTIDGIDPLELYGENNTKLNLIKKAYPDVQITSRGNQVKLKGEKKGTEMVKSKLEIMVKMIQGRHDFSHQVIEDLLQSDHAADNKISQHASGGVIVYGKNGSPIKAKTKNQKLLVECSENNDIVFAVGPAGTGKTYTAVALAIRALKSKLVKKIILTRPAVEAGEHLGFLPGDMKEKVDPYLRPLYDA